VRRILGKCYVHFADAPGGPDAAKQLERLLGLKDQAQYGFDQVGGQSLVASLRQARALVAMAETVLGR
jgi:hypothetical protein